MVFPKNPEKATAANISFPTRLAANPDDRRPFSKTPFKAFEYTINSSFTYHDGRRGVRERS